MDALAVTSYICTCDASPSSARQFLLGSFQVLQRSLRGPHPAMNDPLQAFDTGTSSHVVRPLPELVGVDEFPHIHQRTGRHRQHQAGVSPGRAENGVHFVTASIQRGLSRIEAEFIFPKVSITCALAAVGAQCSFPCALHKPLVAQAWRCAVVRHLKPHRPAGDEVLPSPVFRRHCLHRTMPPCRRVKGRAGCGRPPVLTRPRI